MIELYFEDETNVVDASMMALIRRVLSHAARMEKVSDRAEVSITFVSDEEIQEINRTYRGKDQPTDVISFALEEMGEGEIAIVREAEMPLVLGDILISVDTAKQQAMEYGHPLEREMGFLALHGFLHLLGYDHETEAEETVMFSRQKDILDAVGLDR